MRPGSPRRAAATPVTRIGVMLGPGPTGPARRPVPQLIAVGVTITAASPPVPTARRTP